MYLLDQVTLTDDNSSPGLISFNTISNEIVYYIFLMKHLLLHSHKNCVTLQQHESFNIQHIL